MGHPDYLHYYILSMYEMAWEWGKHKIEYYTAESCTKKRQDMKYSSDTITHILVIIGLLRPQCLTLILDIIT